MSTDRLLGVAGLILAIISLAAAYIFYKKSLKIKQPTYAIRTNNLIQNSISQINGLDITFKGLKVKNLSISKIVFWNKGTETIDNQDIIKIDPLRFECSDDKNILDATVVTSNKLSNQLRISVDISGKNAYIEFDYLDKDNGGVLQIIHTGTSSRDISFKGELKGAIIQNNKRANRSSVMALLIPPILSIAILSTRWISKFIMVNYGNFYVSAFARLAISFVVGVTAGFVWFWLVNWLLSDNRIIPKQFHNF